MHHQFSVGQSVVLTTVIDDIRFDDIAAGSGRYTITRLMPFDAGEYGYVIRHETTGRLRHVPESQIARPASHAPHPTTTAKERPGQTGRGKRRDNQSRPSKRRPPSA